MVEILDARGRPIQRQMLESEPQTARIASLVHDYAGHPSRGLTPYKLAQILEQAEQGDLIAQAELGQDMEEKDGHVFAELSKRKRALLGLEWSLEPPRGATPAEEKATAYLEELIRDVVELEDVVFDALDAICQAYSGLEIEWSRDGREWLPSAITHRPPTWFTVARDNPNELRLRNGAEGEALQPFTWIMHVHKAKSGYLARGGLHRVLAWPFLFKNYSVRDLAEFLEIYGLPARLGKYPAGASDKEKATLLRAVMSIGHNAAGIIPEGMDVDFKEAAKGAADPFQAMIDWCERTQSKAILGGTLTSQADGATSTNALGNVHNEVRWDLTVSDARQLQSTLTRDLVYPLAVLNTDAVTSLRRCPRLVFDTTEPEDLKLYSDALPKLVGIGLPVPQRWAHEKLRIPAPEGDEPVLSTPSPFVGLRARTAAAKSESVTQERDVADDYVDQLEQRAAALMGGMVEPVRRLVMSARSLEEIRDGLDRLYPDMDPTAFGNLLGEALAAAHLAGRHEVNEGE